MSLEAFASDKDWNLYNSSLCIEVTRSNGVFTCTGVAVSQTLLLTAAHCLEGEIKKVRVFTQETYSPAQAFLEIKEFKLHPNYDAKKSQYRSDLAKITMKEKLPPFIKVLPIHKGHEIKGELYRFGFGGRYNKNVRTVVTPKLRKLNLKDEVLELDDNFSRSGDSGGPIFIKNGQDVQLLAIHSTFSHGPEGQFSLNPLLEGFLPWIFEN